jgi:hypothetical protein
MSTFKKFGGLAYNKKNNIVSSQYGTHSNHIISNSIGDRNTRVITESHVDLSGNSLLRVDGLYFLDGSVQRTAGGGGTGGGGTGSSPSWSTGPQGPQGPQGPPGKDGTNISNMSDTNNNTVAGSQSLFVNSVGRYNCAYGERSLMKNVGGYANSAYGYESMVNNTSGAYNTAVGSQALAFNIAGTRNTAIGAAADVTDAAINNSTAIGAGARVNASNVIQLGNNSIEHVITTGIITGTAKNFTIDHPVQEKRNDFHLKHASVEAPRLDLIYRDSIQLSNGKAEVNIDAHFSMTEGTFYALCNSPSVFVSNETDWDPVKASIQGNILTILCKNSDSQAKVAFMVVAERKDRGVLESSITNEHGKFITETPKCTAI